MWLYCGPTGLVDAGVPDGAIGVALYSGRSTEHLVHTGGPISDVFESNCIQVDPVAWDFLSFALAVTAADTAVSRNTSPDGWTREIRLTVALVDPGRWEHVREDLEQILCFLTTDRWTLEFIEGGIRAPSISKPKLRDNETVSLLSGGLDSLVGAVDLYHSVDSPLFVSQIAKGESEAQRIFSASVGATNAHLQFNHDTQAPWANETSQRSRSLVFIALAVACASGLERYRQGQEVPVYICENGFIALNPPLSRGRIGSLSTRTAHPYVLGGLSAIWARVGLCVRLKNPYQWATKGEMITNCTDHALLTKLVGRSISCGRYARHKYRHCGRCVPCLVRRAAFASAGHADTTPAYVFKDLSVNDKHHAKYDDVRAVLIGEMTRRRVGTERWAASTLSLTPRSDHDFNIEVIDRGLGEIVNFLRGFGIK